MSTSKYFCHFKLPKLQTTTPMILTSPPHHMTSSQTLILAHSHMITNDTHLLESHLNNSDSQYYLGETRSSIEPVMSPSLCTLAG